MINRLKGFLVFVLLLIGGLGFSQPMFDQGNDAYKMGNYREAIENWESILDQGQHSAALYYNLGNAFYKLNEIGPSIFYYEKALRLKPGDRDIKNNLTFAQNARIDAIEPLPKTIFRVWYERISGIFSFNGWAKLAVIMSFLSAGLFVLYYFSGIEKTKRISFIASIFLGVVMIGSLTMSTLTFSEQKKDRPAIIFSSQVEVRSEPINSGETVFLLHEGTKVQILDTDGEWAHIAIADGKDGWLLFSSIREL